MIGQKKLKAKIQGLKVANLFPHFSIFVGPAGSGKKTFLRENFDGIWLEDVKVDSIRKLIDMAYKVRERTFIIPDADNMSNAAKNALLKVVEEFPNNNYFIMTLTNEDNTLETIKSRAIMFRMDEYTKQDLVTYAKSKKDLTVNELDIMYSICMTPGDIDILLNYDITEFFRYVNLVIDNIAQVSTANALKIPNKVGEDGYDLQLFLRTIGSVCIRRIINMDFDEHSSYMSAYIVTARYLRELQITGINKQMLIDNWVLAMRGVL